MDTEISNATVDHYADAFMDALESRTLLSASAHITPAAPAVKKTSPPPATVQPAKAKVAKVKSVKKPAVSKSAARATPARPATVVAFYGLGGQGWSNVLIADLAQDTAAATKSAAHVYFENQGDIALTDLFQSLDINGDHVLSATETAGAAVRVLGYSFGGIQAANFAAALADTGGPVDGYRLAAPIAVKSLVTIDPVNSTPMKHTDGVTNNVASFTNFFQRNAGASAIHVTDRATGAGEGDVVFNASPNPVGDALPSAAGSTRQVRVDITWSTRKITRQYNNEENASLSGDEVNHATMPFYLYGDVLNALR